MRKICTLEQLTAKRVESLRSIREGQVSKLIRSISPSSKSGSPINLSKMVNSLIYSIVSRSAFGKVWEGEDIFIPALKEVIEAAGGFGIAELYPSVKILELLSGMNYSLKKNQTKFDTMFQSSIDKHRARKAAGGDQPGEVKDLIDVLLNLQDEGYLEYPLRDENIKAIIMVSLLLSIFFSEK